MGPNRFHNGGARTPSRHQVAKVCASHVVSGSIAFWNEGYLGAGRLQWTRCVHAHAYNDFEIVAANLLDGDDRKVSQRLPGYALYIDPPLGRVGMTETQARDSGRSVLVSKRPMARVGRAIEKGETKGFIKIVADADTQRILGAAILGTGGDEAIHGILRT